MALCLGATMTLSCTVQKNGPQNMNPVIMLVGSYASAQEEGIRVYLMDQERGEVRYVSGLKGIDNPSFLTTSKDGKRVYAVGENDTDEATAHLIRLDKDSLTLDLVTTRYVKGAHPCHIALTPTESHIVTANYTGGSITLFPLDTDGVPAEGHLVPFTGHGLDPVRQEHPHLHYIYFTPDSTHLLANDLGSDCIRMFPLNRSSDLGIDTTAATVVSLTPGSGPRHATFDASGRYLYLLNEIQGDVVVMDYRDGRLTQVQSIQSDVVEGRGCADIHLSPDGKFLYTSNRLRADGIAIFKVSESDGKLTRTGYQPTGSHPRNFAITPNGKFVLVACRDTNQIEIYARDASTGLLTDTGRRIDMPKPVVLKWVP